MNDNYPKAYKEVYEVLKYIPEEDFNKLPKDLIDTIENNMDKDYEYIIQDSVEFEEQPMLRETKAILAVIYRDYWADEIQKERIINKQKCDIQKEEEEKKKIYDYNNLFPKREYNQEKGQALIEYKEEPWYMKFLEFIKKFFHKRKNI